MNRLRRTLPTLTLILLLGFWLRTWNLDARNIWFDEGISIWLARLPTADLIDWTAHDVHPPLYYLMLRGWWLFVGEGEFVLRYLSALLGVIGVALLYRLTRALGGVRAGLLAALLLAVSRFAILWSQQLRMHILAAALATAVLLVAAVWWRDYRRRRNWRAWVGYVLAAAATLYTFYLAGSVLVVTNLAFVFVWWRRGRSPHLLLKWSAAQVVVGLLFAPWLVYILPRAHGWSTDQPFSAPFALQYYAVTLTTGIENDPPLYFPAALVYFGVLTSGLIAILRSRRREGLGLLLLGLVLPPLAVFALSLPIHPSLARPLAPRYFLPLAACLYALTGWGLSRLRRGRAVLLLSSIIAIAWTSLVPIYQNPARRDDYRSLAELLRAHRQPQDTVLLYTDQQWPIFTAQYTGEWIGLPYATPIDAAYADRFLTPLWERSGAVWLVTTLDAQRADAAGAVPAWFAAHGRAAFSTDYGDTRLTFYARTETRAAQMNDLAPGFTPLLTSTFDPVGVWLPMQRYGAGDTVHLALYWAEPPAQPFTLDLVNQSGVVLSQTFDPPKRASSGVTRQQVDNPLPASLASGEYALWLKASGTRVRVAAFTVFRAGSGIANAVVTDPARIQNALNVRYGDSIRLLGYDLGADRVRPGETLTVTLYWTASAAIPKRYKVSVFILGERFNPVTNNPLWGQQDNEPINWTTPTTLWPPGSILADSYTVKVSAGAPAGTYQLGVVLYGLVDGVRLPVFDASGSARGDLFIVRQIAVGE